MIAVLLLRRESVDATVDIDLTEWAVKPSVSEVKAGKIKFIAVNRGTQVHELALLEVKAEGQLHEAADVESIKPGATGSFTATVKPGRYQLACLIAAGEQGSTVDHYQQGMHTEFIAK